MKPASEMDHSELDDEIAIAITRTYATSTRERKKWEARLAELIEERRNRAIDAGRGSDRGAAG